MNKFDEWTYVDCNECINYWDNSCDGTPLHTERKCESYVACRTSDIPDQLKHLGKQLKYTNRFILIMGAALIIHLITHLIW